MLKPQNPSRTESWRKLSDHFKQVKSLHMKELFAKDPRRFARFSLRFQDILLDYSKNRLTDETTQLLTGLANEANLRDAIEKMFTGDKINETEGRAVLHIALRNRANSPIIVEGRDVMPDVNRVLGKMKDFSERLH